MSVRRVLCLLAVLVGCTESVELRADRASSDGAMDARASDASSDAPADARADAPPLDARADSPFELTESGRVSCGEAACACDNGVDDDGDGLTDGNDPECTGPYDDDESSFATGIPGDNQDFCQDCFFDGNSGTGDDGCQYHTNCIYGEAPPGRGGSACFDCEVSEQCVSFCEKRTPNGCDCFGCCDVRLPGGERISVYLAATCSLDAAEDETACPRCTPSSDCRNECGRCELCPGRSLEDLPPDCDATPKCEKGSSPCGESEPCPSSELYCQQGCCVARLL